MRYLTTLLIVLFFAGCANQTAPTGGPKDKEPPQLINSNPANGELNVKTQEISLEFDEQIKLNNAKEQVLITPTIGKEYEISSKRSKVKILIAEPLKDSTTYTINFREGVQDVTEGNSPEDLKLAFSTGPYLDSLSIKGKVTNILTNKPVKDLSIVLYDAKDTVTIINGPPIYLTKSNDKGVFQFENLKNGNYLIYALRDKNKNLILDFKSEQYGFYSDEIVLDSILNEVNMTVQQLDVSPIKLINARQVATVFELKYNKYLTDFDIKSSNDSTLFSNFTDETHQVIQVFNPQNIIDSLQAIITVKDSLYTFNIDTIYLKFEETKRSPTKFEMKVKLNKVLVHNGEVSGQVNFNKPITTINHDSLFVYLDSLNIFLLDSSTLNWNTTKDEFIYNYTIDPVLLNPTADTPALPKSTTDSDSTASSKSSKPEKPPHVYFGDQCFISAENDTSTLSSYKLAFTKSEFYGTIFMEIKTDQKSFTVQLLDKSYKVVQSVESKTKFSFENVNPGEYRVRVLVDSNINGRWDPGNILINQQPEPVIYYKSTDNNEILTIRANWELGPNIIEF